jgi:hypothetical protein
VLPPYSALFLFDQYLMSPSKGDLSSLTLMNLFSEQLTVEKAALTLFFAWWRLMVFLL